MSETAEQSPTATRLLAKEIERFLSTDTPEVLCIRGKWGVGKTYGWNEYLAKAKTAKLLAMKRYAYVSLFGIQSLDECKYAIFENTVAADSPVAEPTLDDLTSRTAGVAESYGRKLASLVVSYIPGIKNASDTLKILSFLTVNRQLICIDDIERKGKSLRTQDVLGLVSFLRENRRCKIVLILNDEELEKEDKEQLAKFQEKVIDASLLFAPNEEECVAIAIPQRTGILAQLAERSISLGISNIRIIKKIERLVHRIEPQLSKYDPAVLSQAVQTLVLFGWAHYGRTGDQDTKLIDFAIKKRGQGWYGTTTEKTLTDEEKQWDGILDAYGFRATDDFDLALLDGIRNGFFDDERVLRHAQKLHDMHFAAKSDQSIGDAWRMFHDSFDDNGDQVLAAIADAFTAHVKFVTPGNLNATMSLFKELGHPDTSKDALEIYLAERADEPKEFWDLDASSFRDNMDDPDMRKAFAEKLATFKDASDPKEILLRIAKNQSWSKRDTEFLSSMSKEDYKSLFHTLKAEELRAAVRTAVGFERISNRGTEYDIIIANSKSALSEISDESALNRRRVRRLVGDLTNVNDAQEPSASTTAE